jgi:hypothetical protein
MRLCQIPSVKPYSWKKNSSDFELKNWLLLGGLQLIAQPGRKEAVTIIPGMLDLSNGFMTKRYAEMQEGCLLLIYLRRY